MTEQPMWNGIPIKWVESLENTESQCIFTKDPATMTEGQQRLLAWLIGSGPYPGNDIVSGKAESRKP